MKQMIVIVGKSGSGKDSIANIICENFRWEKVRIFTTRPQRFGEVNGKDYFFVDEEKIKEMEKDGEFVLVQKFNNWYYCIPEFEIIGKENPLIVTNPSGLEQLKNKYNNIKSFYIDLDDGIRVLRQCIRSEDYKEIERRYYSDMNDFLGIEENVDYIVKNQTDSKLAAFEIIKNI